MYSEVSPETDRAKGKYFFLRQRISGLFKVVRWSECIPVSSNV